MVTDSGRGSVRARSCGDDVVLRTGVYELSARHLHLHFYRILLVVLAFVSGRFAAGQSDSSHNAESVRNAQGRLVAKKNEFGIWTGYSPFSFVLKGTSKDRQLLLVNLQYARILVATHPVRVKYTAEIVPLALELQPTQRYVVDGKILTNPAGTIYGAGGNPIGVQANFGGKKIQPLVTGTLGFLYFHDQVPIIGSSQFNYTVSVGFGVQVYARSGQSLSFGWKYHHLSNDYEAHLNPGIDSGIFYVGYTIPGRRGN